MISGGSIGVTGVTAVGSAPDVDRSTFGLSESPEKVLCTFPTKRSCGE